MEVHTPIVRAFVLVCVAASPWPALAQTIASTAVTAPAPEQAPSSAQLAPRPSIPLPNRVNDALPPWLRLRGEFRERFEGFDGLGFNAAREDVYWLSRVRLHATVAPSKAISFQVQAQDARVARKTVGPTGAPFRAPLDLRMAFSDIGRESGPVTLRVGRQELAFGEQRLVGHVSWLNAARTFDGARVTVRAPAFRIDAFAVSVVRILEDRFDASGHGNRFAGAYVSAPALIPRATLEPYVFWRRDTDLVPEVGPIADLDQSTVGVRLAGRLPARLDYGVEMALQRGSLGRDRLDAWAGHWQMRESLPGPGAVRLAAEYNVASGDKDPADGVRGTFDQLFPTPHDKYGLADQVGWKNVRHVRGGAELTPVKDLPVTASYHSWWLAEARDALYNAGSAVIARVAAGSAGTHIGQEVDVQVSRAVVPQLQIAAGYAHIFPGAFLRQATPGASYSHPYVMATYVFLAER